MSDFAIWSVIRCIWGLSILGTTSYAVFWLNQSPWWFVLGVFVASTVDYQTAIGAKNEKTLP